jgi:hypothetical protein
MDSKQLNDRLQLIASVGVIIGLLMVVYEIRQNSEIARANNFTAILDSWGAFTLTEFESDIGMIFEKSMERPEDLTTAELHKLGSWLQSMVQVWQLQMEMDQGVIKDDLLAEIGAEAFYFFGNHATRAWYQKNRYWMSDEMTVVFDQQIANTPVGSDKRYFDELKEMIQKAVEETK